MTAFVLQGHIYIFLFETTPCLSCAEIITELFFILVSFEQKRMLEVINY